MDYEINIPEMSRALEVSESTIKRSMLEYNISITDTRTAICDDDLDNFVRCIHRDSPNAGYQRVQSQLVLRNINVSQLRVLECMQRTDPEGVAMRWLSLTLLPFFSESCSPHSSKVKWSPPSRYNLYFFTVTTKILACSLANFHCQ